MSGPIIRKYGFPNFEAIFGAREIQHGAPDEPGSQPAHAAEGSRPATPPESDPDPGSPPGAHATEEQKQSEDSAQL